MLYRNRYVFDDLFDLVLGSWDVEDKVFLHRARKTENGYDVSVDLPGVKKESLKVRLDKGYLSVRGERDGAMIKRDIYIGQLRGLKEDEVTAKLEDGVLRVSIPTIEKSKEIVVS